MTLSNRTTARRLGGATFIAIVLCGTSASLQQGGGAEALITEASIRGHMEFLASDAMKGRGSGTEDEWRTAVYIASHLRRWGLEPLGDAGGYVKQIDTGRVQVVSMPTLAIGAIRWTHGREILVQSIGRGTLTGPVQRVIPGRPVAAGAIALVPEGVTPEAADLAEAAAVLVVETPQVRQTWDQAGSRLPTAAAAGRGGRGAAGPPQARIVVARDVVAQLDGPAAGGATATFTVETRPGYTWNAIGRLRGSDPAMAADVILLSAHLDHVGVRGTGPDTIYNGADDDASGSIAVLELAEAISKGPRPKRTIIFAWFGSEEAGGFGSRNFLMESPVPIAQMIAMLQFEMIANRDAAVPPQTLWLTGYERSNLGPELAKQGARIVADPHPEQNFFARSDNIRFACEGVVAQTVSSFDVKRQPSTYHQPTDEISTVDFGHMTTAIRSMLQPVLWLANSTFRPEWLPGRKPAPGNGCR